MASFLTSHSSRNIVPLGVFCGAGWVLKAYQAAFMLYLYLILIIIDIIFLSPLQFLHIYVFNLAISPRRHQALDV